MLLIEYVGHIGLSSLTDGHLGRHLEYFKTLNDARVASVGFIKYNASTTRINKEKNFKIKFQVIQIFFYQTISATVTRVSNFVEENECVWLPRQGSPSRWIQSLNAQHNRLNMSIAQCTQHVQSIE